MSDLSTDSAETVPEYASLLREFVRLFVVQQRRFAHERGQVPQARGLVMLKNFGPLTQGEFARILGLEKSWVSRMVDRYVEEGWVERRALEADRRCVQILLTAAGEAQAGKLDTCLDTHAHRLFEQIDSAEHAPIGAALRTLVDALKTGATVAEDSAVQRNR